MSPIYATDLAGLLEGYQAPAHRNPLARRHRNRYAGVCGRCGGHVQVGWGTTAEVDGSWRIVHLDAECELD